MANYTYNFSAKNTDLTIKTIETENTLKLFAEFDTFRAEKNSEEEAAKASKKAFETLAETHRNIDGEQAFSFECRAKECADTAKAARAEVTEQRKALVLKLSAGTNAENYIDMAAAILANMGYVPGENTCIKLASRIGAKSSNNKTFYNTGKQTMNVSKSKARELIVMAIHDMIIEALPDARVKKAWKFHPEKWDK